MENWKALTLVVAVLYGMHNVFTKLASGKISDVFGGLVLESSAAFLILCYAAYLSVSGKQPFACSREGLIYSLSAGASVAVGSILYFSIFRLGGNLSVAGPIILIGGTLVMVLAGFTIWRETYSPSQVIGLALGVVALWLLSRPR